MPTKVKLPWNEQEYNLQELLELCSASDDMECSLDDVMGGDTATSTRIVQQLVARIAELELTTDNKVESSTVLVWDEEKKVFTGYRSIPAN